jgi:hypothetical protein
MDFIEACMDANLIFASAFRVLPTEVLSNIVRMVDEDGRRNLKEVCLWWNRVTKENMSKLFVHCPGGMRGLIGYPRLQELQITGCHIGENDYQAGKYMQHLHTLVLKNVTVVPFAIIAQLPYLKRLDLLTPNVTTMEGLDQLKMIEELTLDSVMAPFCFPQSCCHPKLRRLYLKECICVRIQARFLGCCKDLEYVHIDTSLAHPIENLDFVLQTPKLNHLAIVACCGEETVPFSLEPLASLQNLEYLNVKGYWDLDYEPILGLETIRSIAPGIGSEKQLAKIVQESKFGSKLESIELFDNECVTNATIELFATSCPNLRRLYIIDCLNVTEECICSLQRISKLCCLQISPEHWWSEFKNLDAFQKLCPNVCLDDI